MCAPASLSRSKSRTQEVASGTLLCKSANYIIAFRCNKFKSPFDVFRERVREEPGEEAYTEVLKMMENCSKCESYNVCMRACVSCPCLCLCESVRNSLFL